jgi:probable rRNA maturation factor
LRLRAGRFLAALKRPGAELSILLVGDRAMRRLNREWRGVDRPTDVLSFPAAPVAGGPAALGDVVVSLDTAERRAREEGRPVRAELDRYLAHGLLHLLGFDHARPRQAREMAARERALLEGEGMVGEVLGPGPVPARRRSRS